MVKLKGYNNYITEAKQVGSLYHVTTLSAVANYIAPKDTLSASGKYTNRLVNRNDVVSFTRDKSFVVTTGNIYRSLVLFNFEVDGDKLSEKYKIIPYNDMAYNVSTGKFGDFKTDPIDLEHEEGVIGSIHPFSKYIKGVRYNVRITSLSDIISVNPNLEESYGYLNRLNPVQDKKLKLVAGMSDSSYIYPDYPSYKDFVRSFNILYDALYKGAYMAEEYEVKWALSFFTDKQKDQLLKKSMGSGSLESLSVLFYGGCSLKDIPDSYLTSLHSKISYTDMMELAYFLSPEDKERLESTRK